MHRGPDGEVYGRDDTDPWLWPETQFLLASDQHQRIIKLLDEFLTGNTDLETSPLQLGFVAGADGLKRRVFSNRYGGWKRPLLVNRSQSAFGHREFINPQGLFVRQQTRAEVGHQQELVEFHLGEIGGA